MRMSGFHGWSLAGLCTLVLGAAILQGCAASTEHVSSWSEPHYADGYVDTVLVVALRDDPVKRRRWEDGFVASLSSRGVTAVPSYSLFPAALPDTQQVVEAIQRNGYGGILSIMRLKDQSRTIKNAGYVRREAFTAQDWYGNFRVYYRDVYEPGDSTTETMLNFQSDLWRTRAGAGRQVWSAIVRVNESTSGDFVRDAIQSGFMPNLTESGMVPAKAARH